MSWYSKVAWSEGLFLRPHHLQQNDRYHEHLLEARVRAATPYPWGFSEIEIDRDLAQQSKFALRRGAGGRAGGRRVSTSAARPPPRPPPSCGPPRLSAARPIVRCLPRLSCRRRRPDRSSGSRCRSPLPTHVKRMTARLKAQHAMSSAPRLSSIPPRHSASRKRLILPFRASASSCARPPSPATSALA